MRKGLNQWSVPVGTPIAEMIRLAAESGFDGVEVVYRADGELGPGTPLDAVREIARLAADAGQGIVGVCSGTVLAQHALPKGADVVRHLFDTAAALETDAILCVPGRVDADHPYDVAYDRARAFLAALVPLAEEYQVDVCIENVWNKFLLSPLEMRDLIDGLDSAHVGVYFDVGNILPYGYPEQWIRILGRRIRRVHIKDARKKVTGTTEGLLAPGEGDVDWPAVMAALGEVGYDGYLTVEVPPRSQMPEAFTIHYLRALSALLDGLLALEGKA